MVASHQGGVFGHRDRVERLDGIQGRDLIQVGQSLQGSAANPEIWTTVFAALQNEGRTDFIFRNDNRTDDAGEFVITGHGVEGSLGYPNGHHIFSGVFTPFKSIMDMWQKQLSGPGTLERLPLAPTEGSLLSGAAYPALVRDDGEIKLIAGLWNLHGDETVPHSDLEVFNTKTGMCIAPSEQLKTPDALAGFTFAAIHQTYLRLTTGSRELFRPN